MTACKNDRKKTLYALVSDSNINFKNTLTESESFNVFKYRNFYNGAKIKKQYKIIGLPAHIIIDNNGYIRNKYIGFTPDIKSKLRSDILMIMKESNILQN